MGLLRRYTLLRYTCMGILRWSEAGPTDVRILDYH